MGATLRDQLFDIRIRNIEGKYFIPSKAVEDVLSAEKIHPCILCSSIEEIRRTDVLRVIENGGKRVFAILLLLRKESLMVNFVQNDHMLQGTNLDSKLPFHLETLKTVLLDQRIASEFCQRQWEFLPPFFQENRNHRTFESETVLPFIEQEELAQGGFGEVFKVTLDANQHGFSYGYGRKVNNACKRYSTWVDHISSSRLSGRSSNISTKMTMTAMGATITTRAKSL